MPTPQPPSIDPAPAVIQGMLTGLSTVAAHDPWVLVAPVVLLIAAAVRSARVAIPSGPRDPVRLFNRADKGVLLTRAGHRCEHHGLVGGRCSSTDQLQADHVHPWSRGGSTHVSNGQILCREHNRNKSAAIPWDRSLRKLAERRASYYPPGSERAVERRQSRSVSPPSR